MSLPVRERGLKQKIIGYIFHIFKVAPRAGAWIETVLFLQNVLLALSLPVRERGLKPSLSDLI